MSKGLMKSRDKKNDLLKKFKQGKINKEVYTKYNKCYRQLIKLEHENCFKKKLVEAGVNGKEKWKVIKEVQVDKPENEKTKQKEQIRKQKEEKIKQKLNLSESDFDDLKKALGIND